MSKGGLRRLDWVRSILNRLYNSALEERKKAWESKQLGVTLYDQIKGLTAQRKDDPEGLGSLAVRAERGMLTRLERAFKAYFRRHQAGEKPGYPRFRPIARMETIDIVDPKTTMVKKRARGYAIRPKGFPTIRLFPSRPLPTECSLKALRIVRKPNRVYVDLTQAWEKRDLSMRGLRLTNGQGSQRSPEHSQGRGCRPGQRNVGQWTVRATGTVSRIL